MVIEGPNGRPMSFGAKGMMLESGGNLNPVEQAYFNARKIGTPQAMESFVNYYKTIDPKGDWAGWVVGTTECFVDTRSSLCKPELFMIIQAVGMRLMRTGGPFEGMALPPKGGGEPGIRVALL